MRNETWIKAGIVTGAALAIGAGATAIARRRGFNLRGWALYNFVKLMSPDLSDPKVLRQTIEKDRAKGPARPPKNMLNKMDFSEAVDGGLLVFRAKRKGEPAPVLKLLYLHGGAYVLDFQEIQWNLVSGLLDRVDAEVIAPIYPLGPEASWRETTAAVRAHYLATVDTHGADNIMVMGDSAGGGLALLLAQAMRDEGLPQPRALVLFSPALDVAGLGEDQPELEKRDPALSLRLLHEIGPMWLKGLPANDPRVSPLFANQENLPPTIIFSGDREILHSDALRLKQKNPAVDHRAYPEMMHVFPASPLKEARQALDEAATFIERHRS